MQNIIQTTLLHLMFLRIKKLFQLIKFGLKKNIFSNIFVIFLILKKISLKNKLKKAFNSGKILDGPYKSIYIQYEDSKCDSLLPKLLGVYEAEIQQEIIQLSKKKKLKYLINFGTGEGYHLISLIKKKYFQYGYAFEIDKLVQKKLMTNIYNNNLTKKIKVFNNANFLDVFNNLNNHQLKKSLFLVDIEGGEYSIFNKKNLRYLKSSFFVIEIHKTSENYTKTYENFLKKYFKIKILNQTERNPNKLKKLENFSENDKWIMMSEARPYAMKWFLLSPKEANV